MRLERQECQQEMQPLMLPDPHCAHCRGTFVEQLEPDADTNPDHDPRRWAVEGGEDDEWADEGGGGGGDNPFAQLLGLFGGGAVGGQQGPVFAAEPGAVADDDYDGQNPFAEGFNGHDGHGGRPASEREGGGEPGVDHPGRPARARQDSDPVPFLQALFGMNPRQQQQQQQQNQPQAGGSGGQGQAGASRQQVYTRTFGGGPAGGGGMFSVTFGPPGQPGAASQAAPAQAPQNPLGEQVPVANLASCVLRLHPFRSRLHLAAASSTKPLAPRRRSSNSRPSSSSAAPLTPLPTVRPRTRPHSPPPVPSSRSTT